MVVHFREYWLFGLFFALVTPLQLLFAWLVSRPDVRRDVLAIGGIANLLIPLVWLVSRTAGLPFGPDAWQAESVHVPDVVATLDELAIAGLIAVWLAPRLGPGRVPQWALGCAWALAFASLIGAMLGASGPH